MVEAAKMLEEKRTFVSVVLDDVKEEPCVLPDGFLENVQEIGIKEPPIVKISLDGSGYEIVDGRRRIMAARTLGFKEILVVVEDPMSAIDTDIIVLSLNLHRSSNPSIEVDRIKSLLRKNLTKAEIADALNLPIYKLRKLFSLTSLCEEAVNMLKSGELKQSLAFSLARLSKSKQKELIENPKLKIKDILTAIREQSLSQSKTLFDLYTNLGNGFSKNPISIKFEEVAAVIRATRNVSNEMDAAINTIRQFVKEANI